MLPGRLSVSRTFGDCVAKMERYGGNPLCIVATPEISVFPLNEDTDFVLMGSDGIFDKLENNEIQAAMFQGTLKFTEELPNSV